MTYRSLPQPGVQVLQRNGAVLLLVSVGQAWDYTIPSASRPIASTFTPPPAFVEKLRWLDWNWLGKRADSDAMKKAFQELAK